MKLLAGKRNQHGFPLTEGEFEATGTHFVSFWWAIFWKEALGVAFAYICMSWAALFSDEMFGDEIFWIVNLLFFMGFIYLMIEIFYAMLEKKFPRKSFQLVPVDKEGKRVEPKLQHARALTWSFLWGHLSLLLIILAVAAMIELLGAFFTDEGFTSLSFELVLYSFQNLWLLGFWLLIFSFYPHFHIFSRPDHGLAGFRLAFIATGR